MKFFGRVATLVLDTKLLQGIDIAFEVTKPGGGVAANKADIKAYNLSDATRAMLEKKPHLEIALTAGYKGNVGQIFKGKVHDHENERQGPDIITKMICADGTAELQNARVTISFEPGVTDAMVLEAAIKELQRVGLGRGYVASFAPQVYRMGYCFGGSIKQLLKEICSKRGLEWSIENGMVQILKQGEAKPGTAVLLSSTTGLVGFPTKKLDKLTARCLLNPNLQIGGKIKLETRQMSMSGLYLIELLKFSGDLREAEFITEIQGRHVVK